MKANRTTLTIVVVLLLLVVGWWLFRRDGVAQSIDLVAQLESAKKQPSADLFAVTEATLKGETKRAISISFNILTRLT